ncbi:MAG: hypothetical protein HYY55_03270 [Candidatus Niyogibacteria bacterium]|nr:MAG: hypothetical protein HYY55_03270 [Candidatus Niyogibacteria bacterium]
MELFLDTCEIEEIRRAVATGHISGVTTNPTLAKKANRPDYKTLIQEIRDVFAANNLPAAISAQVTENQPPEIMYKEGMDFWMMDARRIVVQVPATRIGHKAMERLKRPADLEVRTNVTLIFDPWQARQAMLARADFISLFLGSKEKEAIDQYVADRMLQKYGSTNLDWQVFNKKIAEENERFYEEEIVRTGTPEDFICKTLALITQIRDVGRFATKIVAASIREMRHVEIAKCHGADIAAVPPEIFWELYAEGFKLLDKDDLGLTLKGVERFLEDRKFLIS